MRAKYFSSLKLAQKHRPGVIREHPRIRQPDDGAAKKRGLGTALFCAEDGEQKGLKTK
jgi:hypothetical protein